MNRISKTAFFREAGLGSAIAAAVGLFSVWLYLRGGGLVVEQGPFFGSDSLRVRENLLHPLSQIYNYSNLTMHPLFGLICVAAQIVHKLTGFSEYQVFALIAFLQGALSGLLLYQCARLWGASTALAVAIVTFYCSTAGFIYWSSVSETHVWAGLSLLLLVAMTRWDSKKPEQRMFWGGLSFMVSFSILVTNGMAWLFSRLPLDRASIRETVRAVFHPGTILRVTTELLAGLGLILLVFTLTRGLLHDGRVGAPLAFGQEAQFVKSTFQFPLNGFNAIGLVGPRLDYALSAAVFVNAIFALAACATFSMVPPRLRFVPVFLVFVLIFHSNFVRYQSFLFSGAYTAIATLVLGLALGGWLKRGAAIALFLLSVPLAALNIAGFIDAIALQSSGHGSVTPAIYVHK